jgi:hypothetical protein
MSKLTRTAAAVLCSSLFLLAMSPARSQDSVPPDIDGQGPNNSIDGAVDTKLRADPSRPNETATVSGELGNVGLGFDSVDFYSFAVSPGDWAVTLNLTERPHTTMWLAVYDQNRKQVAYSRGQDNEQVTVPMTGGAYYIAVMTDREASGGRNLQYTLKISPTFFPLPEAGGRSCKAGTNLGNLASGPQVVRGTIEGVNATAYFRFYVPRYFFVTAFPQVFLPAKYKMAIVDDLTAREIEPRDLLSYDPGYYCLKIFNPQIPGPVSYQVSLAATLAGVIPSQDRDRALPLSLLELGNLSENGYAVSTRYVRYQGGTTPDAPLQLVPSHEYVIRDWVGVGQATQWYAFALAAPQTIELRLYNLYFWADVVIENDQGQVVGSTFSEGISLIDGRLPNQVFKARLPAGKYFLRVGYRGTQSPGTPFALWLRAL